MGAIRRGSFDRPDDVRRFPNGSGVIVRVGSLGIGRAVLEPGWRWSNDMQPLQGTASCQVHHLQLVLAGRLGVRMDDGETAEFGPQEVIDVPPGHDAWVVGDEPAVLIDVFGNVEEMGRRIEHDRVVTTLLMTDIVGSTETASRIGDSAWRQRLRDHNRIVRTELERYRGVEVKTTGDGFLATFASALGAVRSAAAIRRATRALGVEVRIGVHTGEVEVLQDDVGGVAVHAAARIMAIGGASEVVVSATTRGLIEGSGIALESLGPRELRGLEQPVEVFRLVPDEESRER